MALLEIQNLASGYGQVQILWQVSLHLEKGRLTSLVGGNGVGKTTLLRSVMGGLRPWEGSIRLEGRDITGQAAHQKAGMGLRPGAGRAAALPEHDRLREPGDGGRQSPLPTSLCPQPRAQSTPLLPRLKERGRQRAGTLSGGEQQMLAVARGLMADSLILMIDELSLGLAPVLVLGLFETLLQLKGEGLTMLLVEQNTSLALAVSDYAYVLSEGRIAIEGPAREVAANEEVRKAYLGL